MNNPIRALVKLFAMRWGQPRASWFWHGTDGPGGATYTQPADARSSAVVQACVLWVCRTFPEAPVRVQRRAAGGALVPVDDHPLTTLLARPNPYYAGVLLWQALLADWMLTGNAYLAKVRSGDGRLAELWWLPARQVEPRWPTDDTGGTFISHYEYRAGAGEPIRLEAPNGDPDPRKRTTGDVVHFRYGLDPDNPRKGLSPLAALLREVFTDDEAAAYTAALLKNLAVPGAVLSFEDGAHLTPKEAEQVKTDYEARFAGNNRGRVLVLASKAKIDRLSFSPAEMNLRELRRIPEERVTAIFGTPAVVVGLGAGLDRSTFANFAEAREAAYESNLIPTQRLFAAELQAQLLPDFGDASRLVVDFDLSAVRVLQPDLDALWKRLDVGVQGGWVTPNEAREQVGLDPLPDADVLFIKTTLVPTDPAELVPPEPAPVPPALEDTAPPPIRALPPPKGPGHPVAAKVIRDASGPAAYAAALGRLRARDQAPFERALASFLAAQGRRTAANVRRRSKALGADEVFDAAAEAHALNRVIGQEYGRVLGAVQPLTEDFLVVSFELDDPTTRAYLAEAGERVVGITATTRDAVAIALQQGQAAGDTVTQLARRVRDATAFGRARATTIARTELGHASQLAALSSFRASGVVVGVRILDGDGCGLRSHDDPQKADGVVVPLEEMGDVPTLAHPNCLVGETMVLAPHLTASFTRWFDGEVVVLRTADDDLLTCTPNHPVLTDRGWRAAGVLRQGDHVLRCRDAERVAAVLDPDHDHVPARIQQVADAVGPARGGTTTTVPTATEAFHGDGAGSDVHVVRTNGLAERGRDARARDQRGQVAVMGIDSQPTTLAGGGTALLALDGVDAPATSGVRVLDVRRVGPAATELHADLLEAVTNDRVADAERPTDRQRRFAGLVAPSEVVHVERKAFSGHVYNLETEQNWYIAGNILTHNCVRAFAPLVDAAELVGAA